VKHVGDGDIKNNGACVWITDGSITVEIYGNDLEDLPETYIMQLLKWASTVWSYDQVEVWTWAKTEDIAQSFGPGYYCIWGSGITDPAHRLHICDRDDEKGLFDGAWPDSPAILPDWTERINSMRVRIRGEMSWHECQVCGRSIPVDVYDVEGCVFCGADSEEDDEPEPLECDDQRDKGLCDECQIQPCDLR